MLRTKCICALALLAASASAVFAGTPAMGHLFITTRDTTTNLGNATTMELVSPWDRQLNVEAVDRNTVVRSFFGKVYVVNRDSGTIQVIDPCTRDTLIEFSVGADSDPQDILVVDPRLAYVTRRNHTHLLRVDPVTGEQADVVDLGIYANRTGLPNMSMMARDDDFLFVQIQKEDFFTGAVAPGYLAIVDLRTERLVNVHPDPGQPLPGVALQGLAPRFKMQVDSTNRILYVSTPGIRNDFGSQMTGIEAVNLDSWRSQGFMVTEFRLGADVSAFVVVSATKAYCISHTDIVESSHLRVFEPGGSGLVPELFVTLHNRVASLKFDAATGQLFFPDGNLEGVRIGDQTGGIRVFDTNTNQEISPEDGLEIGGFPVDMAIVRTQTSP
jgi:hypothetical protein